MYPAYKISVKCSQNLTEQGSGCILLQDDKKNDVGNYFLISGWNSFTSLAISPLNRSMQIRFGIAISALAISEKFHTRAPGPPETMAVATPTIFPVPWWLPVRLSVRKKVIHLPVRGSWCGLPC